MRSWEKWERIVKLATAVTIGLAVLATPLHARQSTSDDPQWDAAAALKSAKRHAEAETAFVAYAEAHAGSPRAVDALIEAGFARFSEGRAAQVMHRNPPAAEEAFRRSTALFDRAASIQPSHPSAPRARYMSGSASYFLWDLPGAAERYRQVVQGYGPAEKYYSKAAVRQAEVLFSLLEHEQGIEVLRQYKADRPDENDAQSRRADRYLGYARQFGSIAPPLSVTDWVQGGPHSLRELMGKPVVLYFTTFWCPNCKKEREFVTELAGLCGERGIVFIEITDNSRDQTLASVTKSVKEWKLEHPVAFDGEGRTFVTYQARAIPNLVLIDRKGNVRWHDHPAAVAEWTLDRLLEEPGW